MKTKTAVVDSSMLTSLDEASVFGAISSYNWLNSELRKLFVFVQNGGHVKIEDQGKTILLDSKLAFVSWAIDRYPHTEFGQSKFAVFLVTYFRMLFQRKLESPS